MGLARRAVDIVLITGGTGFTGSHLVHRLVSEGRTVRVLARATSNAGSVAPVCRDCHRPSSGSNNARPRDVGRSRTVFHVAAAFRQTHLPYDESTWP